MPARELARRGGATKVRTVKRPDGTTLTCYVVRKPGPRGGKTVCVVRGK